jgi:hypothetical protein
LPSREIQLAGPFTDDEVPPYAILSHRWEEDERQEVDYEDMIHGQGRARNKTGYQKIAFCAEQAFQDQLDFFWVDTCCINRSLDGERQLAIESMFRWYQRAAKCYVYLSDVCTNEWAQPDELETALKRSLWFKRGWTLQELLAPAVVEFFSSDNVRLGDKASLQSLIHSITGISVEALQGRRLTSFDEKDRLSWMEPRKTTIEEDKVYALLGIFDVEVHIQYGQGVARANKAFRQAIEVQNQILQDLRVTDPSDDKRRIEEDKGGLLASVCDWVFEHRDFRRWRDAIDCQSLWIRGDSGKGKTMLICSIIDRLEKENTSPEQNQLCYFFCQATDTRINSAIAVLRGLLYMLIVQQPSLVRHIYRQHRHAGRNIFEDVNSWVVLKKLFSDILQDPRLGNTIFIIDALDECTSKLQDLLDFIVSISVSALSSRVKWIFSSRNWPAIEEPLARAEGIISLRLESNADTVARGVRVYSKQKVENLAIAKKYTEVHKREVLQHFQNNAGDTFLWVALVCKSLDTVHPRLIRRTLNEFPPGLDGLYARMMDKIDQSGFRDDCKAVLATVTLAFRPLTLRELSSIVDLPDDPPCSIEDLSHIVRQSGGFLTVPDNAEGEEVVRFVHQSAKDYILARASNVIFTSGLTEAHAQLARRCLQQLNRPNILRKDLCNVRKPGARRNKFDTIHLRSEMTYSCGNWAKHYVAGQQTLCDRDDVHKFLQRHFLHWLEALSWLGQLSDAIGQITQLKSHLEVGVFSYQMCNGMKRINISLG